MAGRPTVETLVAFVVVFVAQLFGAAVGLAPSAFALALPLAEAPWTIVVSVYAHADATHLAANALALVIAGPLVAYVTTPLRFHAFFVLSGSLAGVAQVVLTAPCGNVPVLGASGAIFALFGYLLVGNRASERALSWLPIGGTAQLLLFVCLAAGITIVTAAPGVALVAHFSGFLVGAGAGRLGLLHADDR